LAQKEVTPATIFEEAKALEEEIIKNRRKIHSNPELSYKEFETSKFVAEKLKQLGIEVKTGVGETGVVGILKGSRPGKVIGLRADMDALPVKEEVDLPFKSKNDGVMHACGHDTHVAMMLGAAEILAKHKKELSGTVKFLFQPAEEDGGRGGAKPMIEDGALENPKVEHVFGLHIGYPYASGVFAVKPGAAMAAPDAFKITIKGKGGHGSEPHVTIDPIYISAQVINAIQGISSRMIKQTEPFVISVCSIHSGTKDNIIPDNAYLQGTIRTLDEKTRERAKKLVKQVVESTCKTFGASCDIQFKQDAYPVTYNDPEISKKVLSLLRTLKNGTKAEEAEAILGGEDVSRFLALAPGTFYWLGTTNKAKDCVYPNHSSKFKVDEDVLKYGTASLALIALEFTKEA